MAETPEPDVRLIEISDAADGRLIGHFYLDLYPRDGKYTHAAAFTVIKGRLLEDGTYEKPASAMVANFPKAAPGKPALMPHSEVKTFFHEFGHLMHQTLTKVPSAARSWRSAPSAPRWIRSRPSCSASPARKPSCARSAARPRRPAGMSSRGSVS